jgi:hypothetical protein
MTLYGGPTLSDYTAYVLHIASNKVALSMIIMLMSEGYMGRAAPDDVLLMRMISWLLVNTFANSSTGC